MTNFASVIIAAALIGASTGSAAQRPSLATLPARPGELIFYSDPNFRGQAFHVTGPRTNLSIPFKAARGLLAVVARPPG